MPGLKLSRFRLVVLAILLGLAVSAGSVQQGAFAPGGHAFSSSARAVEEAQGAEVPAAVKAQVQESYGRLPLSFEANQGQTDPQVQFLARGRGSTVFLTSTEAVLVLKQGSGARGQGSEKIHSQVRPQSSRQSPTPNP